MSYVGGQKRPNVFGDDEDPKSASPKRAKQAGAKGTPSFLPPAGDSTASPSNGLPHPPTPSAPTTSSNSAAEMIAAKRAEIQAKLAAFRAGVPSAPTRSLGASPSASVPAKALSIPGLPQPNLDPDLAKKIADARRMVEEMAAKKRAAQQPIVNPYLSGGTITKLPSSSSNLNNIDPSMAARGGLSMAAHPLLMDNSAPSGSSETSRKDRYKPMAPKFSSVKANASKPSAPSSKPSTGPLASTSATPVVDSLVETAFYDPNIAAAGASNRSHMGRHGREQFRFNQKGKFVKLGEALRAEARMEDLKRRILESARKAGIESEMEDQAKMLKRPPPPDIEWWDAPFLPTKSYESFTPAYLDDASSPAASAITHYVQHPIQIPSPQDKIQVAPKPLFLTKKEMKKMRKQRRMAELRDRQDRIKMGLLPPDPPKVKLSNMMRVLTQEAVLDPTKIENQVRREMVARERSHLKANAERKLTPEEKRQKIEAQAAADEAKGIGALCFKVRYLTNPAHRFKVKKNAIDDHLTGVVIHNPRFCLVVVEGGAKGLKHYRQLMLNRIDWTEDARPREGEETEVLPSMLVQASAGPPKAGTTTFREGEAPTSLADNYCTLIWEGQHRERMFRDMRHANCPAEQNVKDVLGSKLEGLWDVAKIEVKEED